MRRSRRIPFPASRAICAAIALAAMAASLLAGPRDAPRHRAEAALAAAISETRLRQTVRDLAALGPRTGGTRSGDAAASYVAEAFRAAGLVPHVVLDDPVTVFDPVRWEVRIGDGAPLSSAWPYRFSPAVVPARRGMLVSADALDDHSNTADLIVYSRALSPIDIARARMHRPRPLAILTSAPHEPGRYTDWSFIGQVPEGTDAAVLGLSFNDGQRVEAALRAGTASASVLLEASLADARPKSVFATLEGTDARRYVLVMAHGDSDGGGPGADDNASGVSAVLETARALVQLTSNAPLPFSIRFAIWGKEYDSAHAYITREGRDVPGCLGVINLDEVGTGAEREAVYAEGNDVPWNERLLRSVESIGADYLGAAGFWPEFAVHATLGDTDSYAFLPAAFKGTGRVSRNIPAISIYTAAWDHAERLRQLPGWTTNTGGDSVITDYSRYYHSSGDVPENTTEREPQNMVRAAKLVGITLLRWAAADDPALLER